VSSGKKAIAGDMKRIPDMTTGTIVLAKIEDNSRLPHKRQNHYWQLLRKHKYDTLLVGDGENTRFSRVQCPSACGEGGCGKTPRIKVMWYKSYV